MLWGKLQPCFRRKPAKLQKISEFRHAERIDPIRLATIWEPSLHTEQGINPEKIDKSCLILNHLPQKGHYVLTFDRAGTDSQFWVRDFLGLVPITDSPFLTNQGVFQQSASILRSPLIPAETDSETDCLLTRDLLQSPP